MTKFAFRIAVAVLLTTMVVLFFTIGFMNDPEAAKHLKDLGSGLGGMFFIGIAMAIYFLPAIIAGFRNHHNTAAILVLNFFLGWTALGWIAAIVWSATNSRSA
jgi:Superinfection immunity protein